MQQDPTVLRGWAYTEWGLCKPAAHDTRLMSRVDGRRVIQAE